MAGRRRRDEERKIGDKIRVLRREGKSDRQAVGEAEGMEREGRLRKGGRYVHVSKSRRRKEGRRPRRTVERRRR